MNNLKNVLAVSLVTLSMAFAGGLSFSMNTNWADIDESATGTTGYTVMFGFNDQTSLGFDSSYGMLATFDVVAGANLRLGWMAADHTIGIGYDFWSSGDAIKTSLGVSVNYTKGNDDSDAAFEATSLNLGVSWGF